jgi:hypothetical protein
MALDIGTILRVVAIMQWLDGTIVENVYNATIAAGTTPIDPDDVVDDAADWVADMMANLTARMSDNLDGVEVKVYEYDAVDDDWDEVGGKTWTWNPTGVSEPLPYGIAALVNGRTTDPDLSGKKYLPGVTENDNDDGQLSSALLTALALYFIDWYTYFSGAAADLEYQPVVWSPTRTLAYPMSGEGTIPANPAYQRRRKVGVGI